MRAQALVFFLVFSELSLSALSHNHPANSPSKLRSWPESNYLILGQSPEARAGLSMAALRGTIYVFGGATATGKFACSYFLLKLQSWLRRGEERVSLLSRASAP